MNDLAAAIRRLLVEGGDANRLVVEAGGTWVVVDAARGDDGVRLRSSERHRSLVAAADIDTLAARVLEIVRDGEPRVREHLGDRPALENVELVDAMRRLSRTRDTPTRQGVYMALIRADLALLGSPDRPHALEQSGDAPVFAVFTDWDALDAFDPRIQPHTVLPGRRLFPHIAARGAGALMINPGGRVGGELYSHEVATICEGIRRMGGA